MNTSSTHEIKVTDGGSTQKVVKNVSGLKQELNEATTRADLLAKKLEAAEKGMVAAARRQASQDSGTSRGIGGQTGAEGRDFAKQAQGLGGLVHVYATFAANIFAVSAAFGALSRAADTTNLVKGLDQLGAASGRNLGTLSKALAMATDNAISLQEAMVVTAQSTAAGMSEKNMLRLAEGAKKVSQALGVNMSDAISRLSRGITKLEPELLDELGIFVRVDKASQDYARSLGKASTALTDFEKRQGFAIAVLDQLDNKFGAIDLESNPYTKLAATFKDVTQSILELINRGLEPLVKFMAASPGALTTVIAGLAALLIKQAIPAIGMFRENARRAQEELKLRLEEQTKLHAEAAVDYDVIEGQKAERAFLREETTQKKILKIRSMSFNKDVFKDGTRGLLRKSPFDLTNEEIKRIEDIHKSLQDKIMNNTASSLENRQYIQLEERAKLIEEIRKKAVAVNDAARDKSEESDKRALSTLMLREKQLDIIRKATERSTIISNASDRATTLGPIIAFKELKEELKNMEGGPLAKTFTGIRAGAQIATSYVLNLANAFSMVGQAIAVAVGAFYLIDSWLDTTAKEASKSKEANQKLNESLENIENVVKRISKLGGVSILDPNNIEASTNALISLNDSLEAAIDSTDVYLSKLGTFKSIWGTIWEGWKMAFGGGAEKEVVIGISKSIERTLQAAVPGDALDNYREDIKRILNIPNIDSNSIQAALSSGNYKVLGTEVEQAGKRLAKVQNNIVISNKGLQESLSVAGKTYDTIVNSLNPSDNFGKLGLEATTVMRSMADSMKDPISALNTLKDNISNVSTLKFFDEKSVNTLLKLAPQFELINSGIQKTEVTLKNSTDKISNLTAELDALYSESRSGNTRSDDIDRVEKALKAAKENNAVLKALRDSLISQVDPFKKAFNDAISGGFAKAADLVATSIGNEFKKAAILLGKANAGAFAGTIGGNNISANLDKEAINVQKAQLDNSINMLAQLEKIRLATEESAVNSSLNDAKKDPEKNKELITNLEIQKKSFDIARAYLNSSGNIFPAISSLLKNGNPEGKLAAQRVFDYASKSESARAQKSNLTAQQSVIDINRDRANREIEVKLQQQAKDISISKLATTKTELDIRSKHLPFLSDELLHEKEITDLKIQRLTYEKEDLVYNNKLSEAEKARQNYIKGSSDYKEASKAIEQITQERSNALQIREQQIKQNTLKVEEERYQNIVKRLDYEQQLATVAIQIEETKAKELNDIANVGLDYGIQQLNNLKEINYISEKDYAIRYASFQLQKLDAETFINNQRLENAGNLLLLTYINDMEKVNNNIALTEEERLTKLNELANAYSASSASLNRQKQLSNAVTAAKKEQVLYNKDNTIEISKQAELIKDITSLTESLSELFGDIGKSIGGIVSGMYESVKAEEELAKKKQEAIATASKDGPPNPEELLKIDAEYALKKQKLENDTYAKSAGYAKKLFAEKSVTYRLLDNFEKGMHLAKIALLIKELTLDKIKTAQEVASSGIRTAAAADEAAVKGAGAVANQGNGDPYTAVPRMVAMAALVATVLSSVGVSSGGISYTEKSSSDYYSTSKETNSSEPLKVISTAIDNLIEINDNLLNFQKIKSLDVLLSIKENTAVMANLLGGNIGINGIGDSKGLASVKELASSMPKDIMSSIMGVVKNIPIVGGLLGGLFGGGGAPTITASGLAYRNKLINNGQANTVSGNSLSWFAANDRGDMNYESLNISNLKEREIINTVNSTQKNIVNAILDTAKVFGISVEAATKSIEDIDFVLDINTQGKTKEQIQTAFEDFISGALGEGIAAAIPGIDNYKEKYAKLTESIGDFALRASSDLIVVTDVLKSRGKDISQVVSSYASGPINPNNISSLQVNNPLEASLNISKAFGSTSKFREEISSFADMFDSDAKKLNRSKNYVNDALVSINRLDLNSKEAYTTAIDSWTDFTEAGSKQYQLLLSLKDKIKEIDDAKEKVDSIKLDKQIAINKLLGRDQENISLQRNKEIATLHKQFDGIDDTIVATQLYIYQLEDEKAAKERLAEVNKLFLSTTISLSESIGKLMGISDSTVDSMKNTINKVAAFKNLNDFIKEKINPNAPLVNEGTINTIISNASGDLTSAVNSVLNSISDAAISFNDKKDLTTLITGVFSALASSATSAANAVKQINVSKLNKTVEIFNLLGRSEEALAITRNLELETIDDSLKPLYRYLYALQDEQSIKDKLKDAYQKETDRLDSLVESLRSMSKSLKDAKNALLLGANSVLTPKQKYIQSQTEYNSLKTTISSLMGKTDAASVKARDEAVNKLPEVSNNFLEASKTYFASSGQYISDFNEVSSYLDATSQALSNQADSADLQLTELKTSNGYLQLMTTNTDTIASLTAQLQNTSTRVATASEAALPLINALLSATNNGRNTSGTTSTSSTSTVGTGATTITGGTGTNNTSGTGLSGTSVFTNWAGITSAYNTLSQDNTNDTSAKALYSAAVNASIGLPELAEHIGISVTNLQNLFARAGITDLNFTTSGYISAWSNRDTLIHTLVSNKISEIMGNTANGMFSGADPLYAARELGNSIRQLGQQYNFHLYDLIRSGTYSIPFFENTNTKTEWENLLSLSGDRYFAKGGLASSGLAIVGEQGPELVDFNSPGRVYTADQTAGMFNAQAINKEIIAELKRLREEVVTLKEQQREIAGHMITATYDAQAQNAEAIVNTVQSTSSKSAWAVKTANSLVFN